MTCPESWQCLHFLAYLGREYMLGCFFQCSYLCGGSSTAKALALASDWQ